MLFDPQANISYQNPASLRIHGYTSAAEEAQRESEERFRVAQELSQDGFTILRPLALTHLVTLVGEAANKYPIEKQKQYPLIAWSKIISMRNRLIHGYEAVDYNILWDAVTNNFPPLLVELEKILPPEEQ